MKKIKPPYDLDGLDLSTTKSVRIFDHMRAFDRLGQNEVLGRLNDMARNQQNRLIVVYHQLLPKWVLDQYPYLDIRFDGYQQFVMNFEYFVGRDMKAEEDKINFVSTILGRACHGRQLLCCALDVAGWLDLRYSLKNLSFDLDAPDGFIQETVDKSEEPYYYKKFIREDRRDFYLESQHGEHYFRNSEYFIEDSIPRITKTISPSFIHLVSETYASSTVPFVTEKLGFSAILGQLFVAYAQAGWHSMIEEYYGFKLYDEIIDYSFDQEKNPVKRLDMLMNTLAPLSKLSSKEWMGIYKDTQEKREYNRLLCVTTDLRDNITKHSTFFNLDNT